MLLNITIVPTRRATHHMVFRAARGQDRHARVSTGMRLHAESDGLTTFLSYRISPNSDGGKV